MERMKICQPFDMTFMISIVVSIAPKNIQKNRPTFTVSYCVVRLCYTFDTNLKNMYYVMCMQYI